LGGRDSQQIRVSTAVSRAQCINGHSYHSALVVADVRKGRMMLDQDKTVETVVDAGGVELPSLLTLPSDAIGLVVFAHGSGSSRHSRRNQAVAQWLVDRGCATLLFDLLTEREGADRNNVFDIPLLGERVARAAEWVEGQQELQSLPIGYFGASTGGAAALAAAAEQGNRVKAVVSRGGRPDLAIDVLPRVAAPTLLIVGSLDTPVIEMNRSAQRHLGCQNDLQIVEGASHLFEEPGKLEEVGRLAGDWFERHFGA
jgi:pimeloyl-ACP methyl ester carboxylesterase